LHLICHGFVKANLFLCVGTVIHSNYGSQEHRACSCTSFIHPFLLMALFVSSLSLRGLFFITCYVSKHLLVLSLLNTHTSFFFGLLLHAGLILSVAYSWRLVLVLLSSPHQPPSAVSGPSSLVNLPIGLLTLPTICAGPALSHFLILETRTASLVEALVPVFTLLLGFFVGLLVGEAGLPFALGPLSMLRRLRYATLWFVNVSGPIKNTEAGPLSPLFYKVFYRSRGRATGAITARLPSLFLSGIIIAALLAL